MNTEDNEETHVEENEFLSGELLKRTREKMNLTEEDVAERLKLRVTVIRELESNSFKDKQVATYTRGYIRSYAKFLNLNPDDILGSYKSIAHTKDYTQKMQSFSRKTIRDKDDSRVMGLTWAIFSVAVSLTAFWWWQNQPMQSLQNVNSSTSAEGNMSNELLSRSTPLANVNNDTDPTDIIKETNELALSAGADGPVADALVADAPVKEDASSDRLTAKAEDVKTNVALIPYTTLAMVFSSDCWVEVYDAKGIRLIAELKSEGDKLALSGQAPFNVVLGAPSSVVNLVYDGQNIDLSAYPGGRIARLRLPK